MGTINHKQNVVKCQIWKHTKWRTKFKQQIRKVDINVLWLGEGMNELRDISYK